jgi:hypothetical protein
MSALPTKVLQKINKDKERQRRIELARQMAEENERLKQLKSVEPIKPIESVPKVEILQLTNDVIESPIQEVIKTVKIDPAVLIDHKPQAKGRGRPRKDGQPSQPKIQSIDELPVNTTLEEYKVIVKPRKAPTESCHGITTSGNRCKNYIYDEVKQMCKIHCLNYVSKKELTRPIKLDPTPTIVEDPDEVIIEKPRPAQKKFTQSEITEIIGEVFNKPQDDDNVA